MSDSMPPPAGGQNPYEQNPYEQGAYTQAPAATGGYASWIKRVGAFLIDFLVALPGVIVMVIGSAMTTAATNDGESGSTGWTIYFIGFVIYAGIWVWNVVFKGGRTGWTIGKGVIGIRLVSESTGQPIGAGLAFVRQIAHVLDSLPCYLGYLWPLWDGKRQTFADKVMSTVVLEHTKP